MDILKNILGNSIALEIIRELSSLPEGVNGRQIAFRIDYSPQAVLNALKLLESAHLVSFRSVGRAKLYTLNRRHWFVAEGLMPLWEKMDSWTENLGEFYMKSLSHKPVSILLYGSRAKGEATEESDIDLLFVFSDRTFDQSRLDEILTLNSEVFERFGIHPSPKTISTSEFKNSVKKSEGFLRNIFLEARSIAGKCTSEVIGHDCEED